MRSLSTNQCDGPEPSQIPEQRQSLPAVPTGFSNEEKTATHDEKPGGIREPRQRGYPGPRAEARKEQETWHSLSSTGVICLSAQLALFCWTQKTLEGNFDSNLLFAQLIIWGSQKVGENNNFPSSCSWPSSAPFSAQGSEPTEGKLFVLVLNQICPRNKQMFRPETRKLAQQNSPLSSAPAACRLKTCISPVKMVYFSPLQTRSDVGGRGERKKNTLYAQELHPSSPVRNFMFPKQIGKDKRGC